MSISSTVSNSPRTSSAGYRSLTRAALAAIGMLVVSTHTLAAQAPAPQASASQAGSWELRFTSGALVATGTQRDVLKDAQMSAVQLSWLVRPSLAITGTFGWAQSRDITAANRPKLDVFTSDLGVEVRPARWLVGRAVSFSPFVGAGVGGRSYNYRKLEADATHNLAGYGAVGGEFGIGRLGLRLEVRDYATGFKPLVGAGTSDTRNDVVIMAGLRFNRHRASQQ